MRTPELYNRFIKELETRIEIQRRSGNLLLPGERDLALEHEVSRKTIRKALAELEAKELVYREKKATKIVPARKQHGKYAFVAMGNYSGSSFMFILYKRLWEDLYEQARLNGIMIDLLLLPENEQKLEAEILKLRQYDLIFETNMTNAATALIHGTALPLIMVCPARLQEEIPSISLDNYSVGQVAANALVSSGSRKTALFLPRVVDFPPFLQRIAGFTETLEQLKRKGEVIQVSGSAGDVLQYITEVCHKIEELPTQGFDGVFFVSDEWIEIFTWRLFARQQIPHPLRVIAFDSIGIARATPGDITTVSNGNTELAAEIIECVRNFEQNGIFPAGFNKTVKSTLQKGGTL